jgi:hypothetical protein
MVTVNMGLQWILSCYIFLCEIFALTCQMMSSERAEASSILVKVQLFHFNAHWVRTVSMCVFKVKYDGTEIPCDYSEPVLSRYV